MLNLTAKKKRNEILGIFLLCLFAFTIVCLISYDPRDPSFNSVSSSTEVHNLAGLAGSYTADLLFQTFGLSAYLLLLPLIFLIIQCFFPKDLAKKGLRLLSYFLLTLFTAGLCSLVIKTIVIHDQKLLAGGLIGHVLTSLSLPYFNFFGSFIIILGGFIATLILSLNVSVADTLRFLGRLGMKIVALLGLSKLSSRLLRRRYKGNPAPIEADMEMDEEEASYEGIPEPEVIDVEEDPIILDGPDDGYEEVSVDSPPEKEVYTDTIPPEPEYESFDEIPPPPDDEESPPPVIVTPEQEPKKKKKKRSSSLTPDYLNPKGNFRLPTVDILSETDDPHIHVDREVLLRNSRILEQKLKTFNVDGRVVEVRPGPVITVYEFEPTAGVKVSKIVNLSDDLALALSAMSVRIIAPIPGKSVVGIELPNDSRNLVSLKGILINNEFKALKFRLPMAMGKTISGEPIIADLARMPHLLVAGATGAGKSVFLNSIICSLLFRYTPEHLRFIMIDPKMLELSMYDDIPHLLLPVVTDPKKAAQALKWATQEMDRRYTLMSKLYVRNIDSFNKKIDDSTEEELEQLLKEESDESELEESGKTKLQKLPYIVIVVDELSDLMIVASKEVELSIARLAQMARAAGIHLVVATQRPSVDVLTGLIKANFPTRIAFQVASKVDSRTILDHMGAEKLLGNGDMLYSPPGTSKVKRVHGAFVGDEEVKNLVEFLKKQGTPQYDISILTKKTDDTGDDAFEEDEELYQEAITLVSKCRYASISMIQRRLRIGYNRAARIIEQMETEGLVGPSDGAKPREVLMRNPE